jgi:HlyD family secretion protein
MGTVTQVRYSPTVTAGVVTYTAIVTVANPELKLRPGMTATASIITGQAKNALKVPNAALRFTPNLTADEMQKIMKATFDSMRAKMGGAPQPKQGDGQGQPATAATQSQSVPAGGTRTPSVTGAANGTSNGGQAGGQSRQGGRRQMARVWVQDQQGQLKPIFVRTGVSDNSATEILWGDLKEGELVITAANTNGNNPFGPPSPMRMLTGR